MKLGRLSECLTFYNLIIMRLSLAFSLVLPLMLSGCSTIEQDAQAHAFRYFNFSQVKSYTFYDRNAAFFDYQSLSDVLRNNIELAIENELDKQGLNYQPIEKADVIISYFWVKQKNNALQHYNKGINYCAACFNITPFINRQQSDTITTKQNSLIIDIIDPIKKRSVWRSSYLLNINVKENSQEVQVKIKRAVNQMLRQYARLVSA